MKIPYAKPSVTQLEIDYVNEAIANGWGEHRNLYIDRFEQQFAAHLDVGYAIATSSCTGALQMGLRALDIGQGDEVILADSNWIATVAPVVHLGAKPVFVDVLSDSWCIDPVLVEKAITKNTKAIIATHIYGNLANMNDLLDIGLKFGVPVIEDAAEAIGSLYLGRRAGSIGRFGVFSFHGSKTISTGEGGMFVTSDAELYEKVLTLSNHGRESSETRMFWPAVVGYKFKMSNIQAAMGCAQLTRVEELVKKRQETLLLYEYQLKDLGNVAINPKQEGCENGAWMPTIVLDVPQNIFKKIFENMRTNGIDVRPFFAPLSQIGLFPKTSSNQNSVLLANFALNLPSYHDITNEEITFVVRSLKHLIDPSFRGQF
jgi:perosamine synthetase